MTWPVWQLQFRDDLVRLTQCRQGSGEEFIGRDRSRSGQTCEDDFALAGHRDAGEFGSRVGMGETAADRPVIAELVMREVGAGLPQQRMLLNQPSFVLDGSPADQGAEAHSILV